MCVASKKFSGPTATELEKAIKSTSRRIVARLLSQGVSKSAAMERFRISLMEHRKVAKLRGIIFEINRDGEETITYSDLDSYLKQFQSIILTVKKMKIEEILSASCVTFVFSLSKYNFVGGVSLPWRMTLPPQVTEKVGEPLLSAMTLDLEKSPLGIDRVRMKASEKDLYIDIRTMYGRMRTEDLSFVQSLDRAKEVVMLFVEQRR